MNKQDKHKHRDTDNSMLMTRGSGAGQKLVKGKGGQIYGDEGDLILGINTQCNIPMIIIQLYTLNLSIY